MCQGYSLLELEEVTEQGARCKAREKAAERVGNESG